MENVDKNLRESELRIGRKRRRDKGNRHRSPKFGDMVLRRYGLDGEFMGEYGSILGAVEEGCGRWTYNGIYNCIMGRQGVHGGCIWRSDKGSGRGLLVLEEKRLEEMI